MEFPKSEPTFPWDLSTDVRSHGPAVGSLGPPLCSSRPEHCLAEHYLHSVTSCFSDSLPLRQKGRQALILRSQSQVLILFCKSQSLQDCWLELNLLRETLDFPNGEYWKSEWGLSAPEESMRIPAPQRLPAPEDGWAVTKLWWGGGGKGPWGQKHKRKSPLSCSLQFWTKWEDLIQTPHFTHREAELKQITWKDYILTYYFSMWHSATHTI